MSDNRKLSADLLTALAEVAIHGEPLQRALAAENLRQIAQRLLDACGRYELLLAPANPVDTRPKAPVLQLVQGGAR